MYFYLKQPNQQKETLIYLIYSKAKFKYSTGQKIKPENWDFQNRLPKLKRGVQGGLNRDIFLILQNYQTLLTETISKHQKDNKQLTKSDLKEIFDAKFRFNSKSKHIFLVDYIDAFLKTAYKTINRNTNRVFTPQRIKHYKKVNNIFKKFEKYKNKKTAITLFDLKEYDNLVNYLRVEKNYSINYAGDIIKLLKVLLKQADNEGYKIHSDYLKKEFKVLREKTLSVALNEEEIESILKHDFSENKKLENTRDLMIIGLWTGLRVSDFMALPKINIEEDFIKVQPKKTRHTTGIEVVIPLHHHIKEVVSKRGMPRSISDVKFNKYIKEVCKEVGIINQVKGSLLNDETKRKVVGIYPKYKLISSHTCRRSFATNIYKMGFPTLSIMHITGHTSERSFLAYVKVTPKEHAQKLLKRYKEYYTKD